MEFLKSMLIASSGMQAQAGRMRIVAENIANAQSTGLKPGDDPYRRQIPTFRAALDRAEGVKLVEMGRIVRDQSPFVKRYDPNHPAADEEGYIDTPNVNALVEMMDMREAQRSYEANLTVISASRSMLNQTVDLLK